MQGYEQVKCSRCGGTLHLEQDGRYKCEYCDAVFKSREIEKYLEGMRSVVEDVLDLQYQRDIGNIRQNLFNAVRKNNIDGKEVVYYCRALKKKAGDSDFYANFYEVATCGAVPEINAFLNGIDESKHTETEICDVLDYITNPVQIEVVPSVRWLIERGLKNNSRLKEKYDTKLDDDKKLIKEGVYDETLPRDVFLAYKSEDIEYALDLCDYLESQGLKCFLSSRNLKHGVNAKNLYEDRLRAAIDRCTVFVFVSTHKSRTVGDARNVEMDYIYKQDKQNAPPGYRNLDYTNIPAQYKKPRVEYLKEDYVKGAANEDLARQFFKGYQQRTSKEAVYNAVDEYKREGVQSAKQPEYKYCKICGSVNFLSARFCSQCGSQDFAATEKEYFEYADRSAKKEIERLKDQLEQAQKTSTPAPKAAAPAPKVAAPEQKANYPTLKNYDHSEFWIEGTILKKYKGKKSEVLIPDGVTEIGKEAFSGCKSLTSITIPNSVTSIGEEAFAECESLTSITIPDSVTSIDESAFSDCTSLKNIKVDANNVAYCDIDGVLFSKDKTELVVYPAGRTATSYVIPDGVTSIGFGAFSDCTSLASITIPNSVTTIGGWAFYNCISLTSVTIPNSVTSIGSYAFYGCPNLTIYCANKSAPEKWERGWKGSCKVVWGYVGNPEQMQKPAVPAPKAPAPAPKAPAPAPKIAAPEQKANYPTLNNYDHSEFEIEGTTLIKYNGKKSEVLIPDGVTEIGGRAFHNCTSLTSITIPYSVTSIGKWAFSDCTSLTKIKVDVNNAAYCDIDGVLFNKDKTELVVYPAGRTDTSCVIPNSVTSIGNLAFDGCTSLKSITIPNSVTAIGFCAFNGCTSLKSIMIPNSVTSIGRDAFGNCTSLKNIKVDVNNIIYCDIDGVLFSMAEETEPVNNAIYYFKGGVFFSSELVAYPAGRTDTSYVIPNTVISIGDWAFSSCTSLKSIMIPNSVTSIGSHAFPCYTSLKSKIIPNSVTEMWGPSFRDCSNLTIYCANKSAPAGWKKDWNGGRCKVVWGYVGNPEQVQKVAPAPAPVHAPKVAAPEQKANYPTLNNYDHSEFQIEGTILKKYKGKKSEVLIPDGVTAIREDAFYYCKSLTSIDIPKSVTKIGNRAFNNCTSFTKINVDVNNVAYCDIDGVLFNKDKTKLVNYPAGRTATSYVIPNGVAEIGGSAFSNCSLLTSIIIPDSVTSIGNNAFGYCTSLKSITMSDSVTSIGSSVFYYCKSLTSITIPNGVTSIGEWAFYNCTSLTRITIPDSVTSIGWEAFSGCTSLANITIPNNITFIGKNAFYMCPNLTIYCRMGRFKKPRGWKKDWNGRCKVVWGYVGNPEQVQKVAPAPKVAAPEQKANYPTLNNYDHSEFEIEGTIIKKYKGKKSEVLIPDGVTSIDDWAFDGCTSLASITIPNSVTSIGKNKFSGCTSLKNIKVDVNNAKYCDIDGVLFNKDKTELVVYPAERTATSFVIPDSVTSIGNYAFAYCTSLTSVTIGNGVTSIGWNAFACCTSLKSIIIPNSVTEMWGIAFCGCPNLTIYCVNKSAPAGWGKIWNDGCKVVWGYKG